MRLKIVNDNNEKPVDVVNAGGTVLCTVNQGGEHDVEVESGEALTFNEVTGTFEEEKAPAADEAEKAAADGEAAKS